MFENNGNKWIITMMRLNVLMIIIVIFKNGEHKKNELRPFIHWQWVVLDDAQWQYPVSPIHAINHFGLLQPLFAYPFIYYECVCVCVLI